MRVLTTVLFCLVVVCLSSVSRVLAQTTAARAEDEAAIRDVVQQYLDAREQRDGKALEALFVEDADQLVSSGQWRRGRDELVKGTLGSSQNNPGTRTLAVETIRFVAPGVALADARYEIVSPNATRRMWSSFLMTDAGGWRIAAIRNMLPAAQNR